MNDYNWLSEAQIDRLLDKLKQEKSENEIEEGTPETTPLYPIKIKPLTGERRGVNKKILYLLPIIAVLIPLCVLFYYRYNIYYSIKVNYNDKQYELLEQKIVDTKKDKQETSVYLKCLKHQLSRSQKRQPLNFSYCKKWEWQQMSMQK